MRRTWFHSVVTVWVASSVVVGGCRTPGPSRPVSPKPAIVAPAALITATGDRPTVPLTRPVDAGKGEVTLAFVAAKAAPAAPPVSALSQAETDALLARLEPLPDLADKPAPIVRPASTPPAQQTPATPIAFAAPTGKQIADAPASSQKTGGPPPLAAPEINPTGDVRADASVRLRFDEPMVPVASVGENATKAPATITPGITGTWRWLDTRVAQFETTTRRRFPMATEFTVTVPAGTRAVSGATLGKEVVSRFATSGPRIVSRFPDELRPDSPISITFDQDVDPAAIATFLDVQTTPAGGGNAKKPKFTKQAFVVTTLADAQLAWAKNPRFRLPDKLVENGARFVVIAPKTSWPSSSDGTVSLNLGAPSKEGPRTTTAASSVEFSVVPKFTVLGLTCGELTVPKLVPRCSTDDSVEVNFANPIDPATFRDELVQIAGQPSTKHNRVGRSVNLPIPDAIGKSFTIKLATTGIVDVFGQSLVDPRDLTFTTTKPPPYVPMPYVNARFGTGMYILDPRFAVPQWIVDVQAVGGLRIELYRVQPSDWFAYQDYWSTLRKVPPGTKVFDKTYGVGSTNGGLLRQDLSAALDPKSHTGHVIAVASASPAIPKQELKTHAWIQVTKLGVTARSDGESVNAWVDSIAPDASFLRPVPAAKATLVVKGRTDVAAPAATDADGRATFALPAHVPVKKPKPTADNEGDFDDEENYRHANSREAIVVARAGADSVFTQMDATEKATRHDFARWYVTDDRFTYKPGEPLFVKGWLRWTHDGVNPDIRTQPTGTMTWSLSDSRGIKLASGTAPISDQGGFDLQAAIPATAQLGTAHLEFSTPIPGNPTRLDSYTHNVAIQEFRTPAFSVSLNDDVTHGGATPLIAGEAIGMAASARYFGGGGLGGAKVKWDVSLRPGRYHPPGWEGFAFNPPVTPESEGLELSQETQLSGEAESTVMIAIPAVPFRQPATLFVDATVTDVDRQTIRAGSRHIVVHASAYYVGTRVRPGSNTPVGGELEFIVTDVDGKPVPKVSIDVAIEGNSNENEEDKKTKKPADPQHCTVASSETPARCRYTRKDRSYGYQVTATIVDGRGRENSTSTHVPWWAPDEDAEFKITGDKAIYRVGDVAKVTVHSKVLPAVAVVTFARHGVIAQQRLDLTTEKTVVDLPISPGFVSNVHVIVDRWTKRAEQVDKTKTQPLPDHDSTSLDLAVDLESARLAMTTRPLEKLVEPGTEASFEVVVRKADKPVANAEVALIVVDEAVLSLSGRNHEDPLPDFYAAVEQGTSVVASMSSITDAGEELDGKPGWERWDIETHGSFGDGYGIGGGRGGMRGRTASVPDLQMGSGKVVETRKDFRATAVFSPRLHTDADGKVTVTVKMPDSLTRFRIVALATANNHWFGKAESTIATQLPINARTVVPRFLTQGDTFGLPVVVQNLDRKPRTVSVAVRAANLTTSGVAGKRVTLAAGQRAEVRFDLATRARGAAAIQTIVASDATAAVDANTVFVQVYEPATTESFATYGIVDDKPQFERLVVPGDIYPEVGGVEAEVSSTQLQSLTDAYWYLYAYPYECAEQRSSRMLATAAMFDVLEAFASPNRPTRAEIEATRGRDIAKLSKDQNQDGGWNFYPGMKSDPFITQQVLAALVAGKDKSSASSDARVYVTREATARLARLEASAKLQIGQRRERHTESYDVALTAAAFTTLAAAGVDVKPRAQQLHAAALTLDAYPIDAKARVLALLAKQPQYAAARGRLLADLLGAVRDTAAGATITAKFVEAERLLFVSNTKTTALALDALIRETPQHAVIAKLARGVLEARKHGRWTSTQENLVVLQAMRRYFDTYEKVTPNYTGKLWFGAAAYAEQPFVGRTNLRGRVAIDWPTLGLGKTHDLTLDKTGAGRMYYRVGITYAPKQVNLPPLDAGFVVRRTYVPVDAPSDVVQRPDGGWTIKLGARVVVKLEVINTTRRNTVGFADPLPAGFEPVNSSLANAERAVGASGAPKGATYDGWDYTTLRDNRAEGFASSLAEGSHHFSYTVRATTPGTFIAAPTKAEEMYAPETFGRSAGVIVVIE